VISLVAFNVVNQNSSMLMISVSESVLVKSECFFNKGQSGMDDIETQKALGRLRTWASQEKRKEACPIL
jgi:hypothetical protein